MGVKQLQKLLAPIVRRVRGMVSRGIITMVNDTLKEQGVQLTLLADEVRSNVERYQEYGFTSHPHPGAEAIVVHVGGNRDHGVVIATGDRRYRLKSLAQGEVALYDDQGQKIHLARSGIYLTSNQQVVMTTPNVFVYGNIVCSGNIYDAARSMAADRNIYNGHTHPGDSGGTTGSPNQSQ